MNRINEQSSRKKWAILIASVLLCAAIFSVGTARVVLRWNGSGNESPGAGELSIGGIHESTLMSLMAEEPRDGVVTLLATVTPSGAEAAGLTWTAVWKDSSSSFAKAHTDVGEFIRLTPNGTSCSVELLASFGEQIVITVFANSNSNAKASCTVDFRQKIEETYIRPSKVTTIFQSDSLVYSGTDFVVNPIVFSTHMSSVYEEKIHFTVLTSEHYTIGADATATVRFYPTDEFANVVRDYIDVGHTPTDPISIDDVTFADVFNRSNMSVLIPESEENAENYLETVNAFNRAVKAFGNGRAICIEVTVKTAFETQVHNFYLCFDSSMIVEAATSLSLNQTSIIF